MLVILALVIDLDAMVSSITASQELGDSQIGNSIPLLLFWILFEAPALYSLIEYHSL